MLPGITMRVLPRINGVYARPARFVVAGVPRLGISGHFRA
jgi:hypothetical protein